MFHVGPSFVISVADFGATFRHFSTLVLPMKPRLSVNLDVVNQDPLSPQTLTFRGEGVSVGVDYFRLHGQLVSDVASQYISIQELIGKGAFSRVHKAEFTRVS